MSYRFFCLSLRSFICALASLGIAAHAAPPLSLAEALRLATIDAPQLSAQASAVRAAQQGAFGATEQADPKLIAGIENLPLDGADKFNLTRDFMTMRKIGFMQEFVRSDKLQLRGDRANADVRREGALLVVAQLNLKRDVALAWIERYFAERQFDSLQELMRESELQVTTAEAALAGGKGQASDPFVARLAVAQLTDRMIDAERMVMRAQTNLARWIGSAAKQPLDRAPAFNQLAHNHRELVGNLESHPHLAMYAPQQAMALSELKLAEAAKQSDWSLEVAYAQRGPAFSNMLSIGIKIDLPIFQSRRQDPAIAAKVAAVEQIRAQTEDARRIHAAEIENLLADWNAAKSRVQRFARDLLPLAHERSEVALAAYRGGKGDLTPVLDARRAEVEVRMNRLQAEADMARAWANLSFLLPDAKDPT